MTEFEFIEEEEEEEKLAFFEYDAENDETDFKAKIRVIGVGGGGGNAVHTMVNEGIASVEFAVVNTDAQALRSSPVAQKIQIGKRLTRGLGAGGKPEIGEAAAKEDEQQLREYFRDADMVFITAGMGGGTGTGSAPVLAKIAKEEGALTVGVVTKPFNFEGRRRMVTANNGLEEFRANVDTMIVIPNQQLLGFVPKNTPAPKAFAIADSVLCKAVKGISELITGAGHINVDFADVQSVMSEQGMALMGVGICSGENRAIEAAQSAINSPLLEDSSIDGAKGLLINVTGSNEMTLHEINDAATLITETVDPNADVFFGALFDDSMGDDIRVTVIATGFAYSDSTNKKPDLERSTGFKIQNYNLRAAGESKVQLQSSSLKDEEKNEDPVESKQKQLKAVNGFYEGVEDLDIPTFIRKHVD